MPTLTISASLPNGRPRTARRNCSRSHRKTECRLAGGRLQAAGRRRQAGRRQAAGSRQQAAGSRQQAAAFSPPACQPPAFSLQPPCSGDQPVEFELQLDQNLVVGPGAERLAAAFQVHRLRTAPQPEVRGIRFTRSVHAAPHHGNCNGMVLGVAGHGLDLLRQFDKRFVFDTRTAGTRDDVQPSIGRHDGVEHSTGVNVVENLSTGDDLLLLLVVGHGQGNANRVADAATDELFQGHARLDDPVGRQARFGHTQVQWHVRPGGGETAVDFDDLGWVGVLERHAIASEVAVHRAAHSVPVRFRASE